MFVSMHQKIKLTCPTTDDDKISMTKDGYLVWLLGLFRHVMVWLVGINMNVAIVTVLSAGMISEVMKCH